MTVLTISASVSVASCMTISIAASPTSLSDPLSDMARFKAHSALSHRSSGLAARFAVLAATRAAPKATNAPKTANNPAAGGPEQKSRQNGLSRTKGGKQRPTRAPRTAAPRAMTSLRDEREGFWVRDDPDRRFDPLQPGGDLSELRFQDRADGSEEHNGHFGGPGPGLTPASARRCMPSRPLCHGAPEPCRTRWRECGVGLACGVARLRSWANPRI